MKTTLVSTRAGQGVNWSEIHQRVEIARLALEQGAAPSARENQGTLRVRARALARVPPQAGAGRTLLEIVAFSLASETYGLASAFVREVCPLKAYTPLPGVPPFVLGLVNVRGQILSIIDLKKLFNLPDTRLGQLNKLIVLRHAQMELAIVADDILGARLIELEALQAAPPTVSGIGAGYLRGVTAERMVILDAEKILNDEQIVVHQDAE